MKLLETHFAGLEEIGQFLGLRWLWNQFTHQRFLPFQFRY
jgi:hypothetical protein